MLQKEYNTNFIPTATATNPAPRSSDLLAELEDPEPQTRVEQWIKFDEAETGDMNVQFER